MEGKQLHAIARSNPSRTLPDLKSMSLRSRRKHVPPGKRSAMKWNEARPRVPFGKNSITPFSGRQRKTIGIALSPAKAGFITNPLAYPGFRSPRSLHPGLNSAARAAGSLRDSPYDALSAPERFERLALFVALLVMLCAATPLRAQAPGGASRPRIPAAIKSPDGQRSLRSIHSRAEFDSLSVVYDANTP